MKLDLDKINEYIDLGYLRTNTCGNLRVLTYNEASRFKLKWSWDDLLRTCRGIVIERYSGNVVAHCVPKCFNYKELPESSQPFPSELYEVTTKLDGSLIHIFAYEGLTYHTTKASFTTIYSQYAKEILPELEPEDHGYTLVCECRLPNDPMGRVTDIHDGLYLITVFDPEGRELPRSVVELFASQYKLSIVPLCSETVEEIVDKHITTKGIEGWVVRWQSGLRIKFKTIWYKTLNRILEEIDTPAKALEYIKPMVWRCIQEELNDDDWLNNLPAEYREDLAALAHNLRMRFAIGVQETEALVTVAKYIKDLAKKDFALAIKDDPRKHILFACWDDYDFKKMLWTTL